MNSKIDVHHHIYAPFYTEALNATGGDPSGWYIPPWTLSLDRALCARIGVQTAILSPTAPFPDNFKTAAEQASFARRLNEYSARIRDEDPEHYGFFAAVPSPRFGEECLGEIGFALGEFADGVVLLSRYDPDLMYLGHKDFVPVWEELNRREAVVFVHPTHGTDTRLVNPSLPQPMWDYPHETGRTAIDLITSNTLRHHASSCKIILSHAGGTLPMLLGRAAGMQRFTDFGGAHKKTREEIYEEAGWFYYDTALSSDPGQLAALQAVAGRDHILFGSDFPNCPEEAIVFFTQQLEGSAVLSEEHREGIDGGAGRKLFPRLAKS
ncbi:hypothetical protein M409DRAFT_18579 [Zasmidium cellare ATCC 36951]|uniref:6-methylsalicylate decarboxylase n=1 Tax=Zasmidium cellare ATCC 36951 TaxID=1080233 RepID=A0A6A6CZY2_ZASCE|nr:uncharacterized protein M409DRAFT_18579 [Zasmidium cellare ATCC 36951]KAF2171462.1 hypothetical protein M409DRAFT_18579 [Zasmidium cellare ATCC 36951]